MGNLDEIDKIPIELSCLTGNVDFIRGKKYTTHDFTHILKLIYFTHQIQSIEAIFSTSVLV